MDSINKDYNQVIDEDPKNINSDGSLYRDLESELNIFNPGEKITNKPRHSLKEIINYIDKTKKWKVVQIKNVADDLWQYYIIYNNLYKNDPKKQKKILDIINNYIQYLEHQSKYLDFFSNNILTLVATIFLPLTFITGFFGMNFKSMGAPSLKKGIFTVKYGDVWVAVFSLVIFILLGWQFNQVYHIWNF